MDNDSMVSGLSHCVGSLLSERMTTVDYSIAVIKKVIKISGFNGGFKPVVPRKKRRDGILKDGFGSKKVVSDVQSGYSWGSETGNTIEFNSIDIEKKCLVEKTSFDYGKYSIHAGGNPNQTPKSSWIKTKKTLDKPLGKINFLVEIIKVMFTSKSDLMKATEKATGAKIMVNTNLKISSKRSDWAVVVKEILIEISTEAVHIVLSKFGTIKSIKMQLVGM
ncbi:hypothetical protein G9A89_018860 [Geosiphon pyriformis]|nr:hypothetical protein G9A89_018860 [Geosiphon pyriformis]